MVARLGRNRLIDAVLLGFVLPQLPGTLPALDAVFAPGSTAQQEPSDADGDVERLRAMLALAGPEGREARETAIERLLVLPQPDAHRVLHDRLAAADDPDGVRAAILASLQRHWTLPPPSQLGGATGAVRERILADYLRALAPLWRPLRTRDGRPEETLVGAAAVALQRLPVRDLEAAARALLPAAQLPEKLDVLRCLADMQQVLLAPLIAEHLDAAEPVLQRAAQDSLQLLTYADPPVRTREQFQAWFAANGALRYVDLVQRAARAGAGPLDRSRELTQVRVDAAREIVRTHVTRTPGIDWAAVQARVVGGDDVVLDACLELLQTALPTLPDDAAPARAAFCRALLQRYRAEPPELAQRRARLLEVAAWLGRPDDAELAKEIVNLLLPQLDASDPLLLGAALRGLRRYPSVETRGRLAVVGLRLLEQQPVPGERIAAVLATLGWRTNPRWTAPLPADADKVDWVALVAACCRADEALGLREPSLALAQLLTARDQRVPEVFDVLLALVRDESQTVKYRATCLLHLQGWRNSEVAERWVVAQHELLSDAAAELRQLAADSLVGLTESVHEDRSDWLTATIGVIRQRLKVEPEVAVVKSLVTCLQTIGREPGMPEKAIGALRWVLTEINYPVPPEHEFRIEPLLGAVAAIGADSRADPGQWLSACASLAQHKRRQSLRLVLQSHTAIELAKDVASSDPSLANRAKNAMQYVIAAAAMKPPQDAWTANEELQREAIEVRRAFLALDGADEKDRPDGVEHRFLRLEVDLAANKPQEVVQRATAWLAGGNGAAGGNGNGAAARAQLSDAQRDRVREIAAAAQLALGRPDAARKLLDERTENVVDAAVLDIETRVARQLAAIDLAGAIELYARVVRRTPTQDPQFRPRVVEWLTARLKQAPADRAAIARDAERHRQWFEQPDCPTDLLEQWKLLLAN